MNFKAEMFFLLHKKYGRGTGSETQTKIYDAGVHDGVRDSLGVRGQLLLRQR